MKKLVITFLFFGYIVFFSENVVAVNQTIKLTPSQFDENFTLKGAATKVSQTPNNVDIRLTQYIPSTPNGSFTFNDYLSFDSDFSLQAAIKVVKKYNTIPADGFSFIFYQGQPDLNKGMSGQGLGMLGIPNAMGLVIDLFKNAKDDNNVKYWQNPDDAEDPPNTPYYQLWSTDSNGLGKREMNNKIGLFESNFFVSDYKDVNITYNASSRRLNYQVSALGGMQDIWYTVPESYRYGSLLVSGSVGGLAAEQSVRFKGFSYDPYRERTVEFVDNVTGEVVKTTKVTGQPYDTYSIDPMLLAKSKDDGGKDITPYYTI
uniref:lectin-like domain-containing protein n=1 Tax=Vagococcus TaxID=2737 RepID=UPI000FF6BFA8